MMKSCKEADPIYFSDLLRLPRYRPRHQHNAERLEQLASIHSINSSARASNVPGTSRPSALAVLRLIASSNLVGACTGSQHCCPLSPNEQTPAGRVDATLWPFGVDYQLELDACTTGRSAGLAPLRCARINSGLIPSALAVVRLIARSKTVGCCRDRPALPL